MHLLKLYIVVVISHNKIYQIEPCTSYEYAKERAVRLSNEWYRSDGIEAFGKYKLESFEEMQDYYGSDAYYDSGDAVNICIKEVVAESLQ